MIFHLFNKSADQSSYVEIIPGKNIQIEVDKVSPVHVDGEPIELGDKLDISIMPKALKIIC
jgi:diacylglycerol kinase family enzyme